MNALQFSSLDEFIAMGGYGYYVWLSFGISTFLILALWILTVWKDKTVRKHILSSIDRETKLATLREQSKAANNNSDESQ